MLNDKQRELARTEPKAFLEQFKLLRARYENELDRVNFWQNCEVGKEYCEACIARARRLVSLEADIADLLDAVEIKEGYRLFLHLRFIVCLKYRRECSLRAGGLSDCRIELYWPSRNRYD